MSRIIGYIIWTLIAFIGASCFGVLAMHTGESINAIWFIVAAVCIYVIAYRFYSKYIAFKVLELDDNRATPAVVRNDGRDFVPTNKIVLFGHHFAAIAGAGPLVGPILAAQMGYLPSMIWLVVGVVLAGAVHDFVILFLSTRRDGKSLGEMMKMEIGNGAGIIAMIGILGIMMLIIAILALVVVNALAESPWGLFTIAMTIPIAIYMGIHMRFLRPGKIGEASIIGFILLLLALHYGNYIGHDPYWSQFFKISSVNLTYIMIAYGFIASVLPVWFLLAPRDYLSTFLKIGVIVIMAISILIVNPPIDMPKVTQYIDGSGPVFSGKLFPFLFITIACGAISGFHALISSGTTPKMLEKESHARMVGYGSMLMESAVGVMALITAIVITPGLYFAINVAPVGLGTDGMQHLSVITDPDSYLVAAATAANSINSWANGIFNISAADIVEFTKDIGEPSILSRIGGAPTFAIGFASIISEVPLFNAGSMAFWYHFAILFEALFILTAVDAGTRAGRFMIQDLLGNIYKPMKNISSYPMNIIATLICVSSWGYFLYQGVTDPQGGIKSLWTLFGVSNQLLAGMALLLAVGILFKMGKAKFAWVVIIPVVWVLVSTMTAGIQKLLPANGHKIHDSVSHVAIYQIQSAKAMDLLAQGDEKGAAKAQLIANNNLINAILCAFFLFITLIILFATIKICIVSIRRGIHNPPLAESPYLNAKNYEGNAISHG